MHMGPFNLIEGLDEKHLRFANKYLCYPNNRRYYKDCMNAIQAEFPELTTEQARNLATYTVVVIGNKMGLDD